MKMLAIESNTTAMDIDLLRCTVQIVGLQKCFVAVVTCAIC